VTSPSPGASGSSAWRPAGEPDASAPDRDLFDAVLRETESALGTVGPDSAGFLADLREVARSHHGRSFEAETIGPAMVRVLLDRQVSRAVASSRMWRQVCDRVAETLCSDPASRERLERLWGRLQAELR
jgi:hypothetical protein